MSTTTASGFGHGPGDPGLQPQRTALAWSRTALSVLVNALLVLRSGAHGDHPALLAAGWLLLAGSGVMMACGVWRRHTLLHDTASGGPPGAAPHAVVLTALGVAGLTCACGALSLWFGVEWNVSGR